MDCPCIRSATQHPIQSIYFANQMPLTQATNSRVTAHRANCIQIKAYQSCACAHTRRRTGRFNTGMSAADYKDIKLLHGNSNRALQPMGQRCSRETRHFTLNAITSQCRNARTKHPAYLQLLLCRSIGQKPIAQPATPHQSATGLSLMLLVPMPALLAPIFDVAAY